MRCSPAEKEAPMASEVPACPENCEYRKSFGGHWPYCDYWEMEPGLRDCDPGPGCNRYLSKRQGHRKGKTPTWDVKTGKRRWEEGYTDTEIGEALGVRRQVVYEYRSRNWGQINRERQKKQ